MKADETMVLKLDNSLAALAQLHAAVGEFCRRRAIHPDIEFKIDLALEEVFTNIVRHGYDDSDPHEIMVRLHSSRERIRIRIEDDGRHFNPLLAPAVDLNAALSERRVGGLGVHLVRRLMDQVRYRRQADGNQLTLVKRLAGKEKRT
jgi:anti-sigma regulatory factor (Ser/Thr protein kinase)